MEDKDTYIQDLLLRICKKFPEVGKFEQAGQLTGGLINSSWQVKTDSGPYVVQIVNTKVFSQPGVLMQNAHKASVLLNCKEPLFRAPIFCLSDSNSNLIEQEGQFFRAYKWIEGEDCSSLIDSAEGLYQVGRGFGLVSSLLSRHIAGVFELILPEFNNLSHFASVLKNQWDDGNWVALEKRLFPKLPGESRNAIAQVKDQLIHYVPEMIHKADDLLQESGGFLPVRAVHNDTKSSNLIASSTSPKIAIGILDLDTIQPGYIRSDFGDMVRSAAFPQDEDEPVSGLNSAKVINLVQGYLDYGPESLSRSELVSLKTAPEYIALNLAIRFLVDFFQGSTYFAASFPLQNFLRAIGQWQRCQLLQAFRRELVECIRSFSDFNAKALS